MLKKLVLIVAVLIVLLATTTSAFAQTDKCDPPPTPGQTRNFRILCYFDTSPNIVTTEMGTRDQPFKTEARAIAEARAHIYGGYVINKQTGASTPYDHTITGSNGAPISRTGMFALLGLASLTLVAVGWSLRRRARNLPRRI